MALTRPCNGDITPTATEISLFDNAVGVAWTGRRCRRSVSAFGFTTYGQIEDLKLASVQQQLAEIDRCFLEINKVTGLGLTLAIAATG